MKTRSLLAAPSLLLGLLLCLLCCEAGLAQYRIPQRPRSQGHSLRTLLPSRARTAGSFSYQPLTLLPPSSSELRALPQGQGLRTFTFAVERPLHRPTSTIGELAQDETGGYIWRATIQAPGAKSIGLRLGSYALPSAGALYIYAHGSEPTGALTSAHNSPDSLLQIAPITGQAVELLYEFPAGTSPEALQLPFRIEAAFYGFRSLHQARADEDFAQIGEPFYDHPRASLEDLACAPNVLSYPDAWQVARSTVLLIVGGTSASTGALINTPRADGTPYVLTSAHCLNNLFRLLGNLPAIRRNAATTVFFFGFQSPLQAGNVRGSEEQSLSGASLIGYSEASEMCLLRIEGLPTDASGRRAIPTAYQPYFAGWSLEESPAGPFTAIHHPGGSTKRYGLTADQRLVRSDYSLNYRDASGNDSEARWYGKHWLVRSWAIGMTASGSSGSGLFDAGGHIIGALTGGASSCESPYDDRYWSLLGAWRPERAGETTQAYLQPWLDPDNTGALSCEGYDPNAPRTIQRLSPIYPDPVTLPTLSVAPNRQLTPRTEIDGVGNRLQLPASRGTRVLGAFLVFKADGSLRASDIPQLRLSLQRFAQREEEETPLLTFASTSLGQFARFTSSGAVGSAGRTLRTDTIELFFPAPAGSSLDLEEGAYLLSLRTQDGRQLPLSLLGYEGESPRTQGWSGWTHSARGGWERSHEVSTGAYWIDLLLDTPRPITLSPEASPLFPEGVHCYYHAGTIHLSGDGLLRGSYVLRVYDLTGKRYVEHTFAPEAAGAAQLRLQLPAGQYVASLTPAGLTRPKRSQRQSFTFVHR